MSDPAGKKPRPTRLWRLCQLLGIAVLIWAIVTTVRMLTPPAPLKLARQAVESGHFDAAVEDYLRHLARNPEDWHVRNELGVVLAEIDRPQALVEFRKVPPDSEVYPDALRQIAAICLASERLQEAEQALVELNEKTPDEWSVQLMLAEVYFLQQRARAALPHAQKSAELNPEHVRTHFLVAELLDELKRPAEMIAPLERVLTLQPDNYAAHLNLAYAYAEAGQSAQSRREAEWCLVRNPADVHARRYLALAARADGNLDEAMREIETALQVSPDDLECRLLEAELLLFEDLPEKALERLKPLYQNHARDRRLVALLARAASSAGRKEEAEQYRQQVQKLSER